MLTNEDLTYLQQKRREIIENCPICHGTKAFCSCAYTFRLEIHKATAQIPIIYRDFTLDKLIHPQLQKQKKQLEEYMLTVGKPNQTDLLITGGPGLAKTAVACAILTKALSLGKQAFYIPSLRAASEALFADVYKQNESAMSRAVKNADTIVLDGLGYGFVKERNNLIDLLFEHLNRRKASNKHVVLISGVPERSLGGAEKDLIELVRPLIVDFAGFNFVTEVLEKADPQKAAKVKKSSSSAPASKKKSSRKKSK